jgi:hypothetical protein
MTQPRQSTQLIDIVLRISLGEYRNGEMIMYLTDEYLINSDVILTLDAMVCAYRLIWGQFKRPASRGTVQPDLINLLPVKMFLNVLTSRCAIGRASSLGFCYGIDVEIAL